MKIHEKSHTNIQHGYDSISKCAAIPKMVVLFYHSNANMQAHTFTNTHSHTNTDEHEHVNTDDEKYTKNSWLLLMCAYRIPSKYERKWFVARVFIRDMVGS